MEHLKVSIVLEHTAYSLASAGAAVVFSLGLGWLFAKLACFIRRQPRKPSLASAFLPIRAIVFGLAGATYLSHLVMMIYFMHYGLTANWVFVASAVAMTCIGTWVIACSLTRKWLLDPVEQSFLPIIHTLFVVAPWLCLRPGALVAGGGLGSIEIQGVTQLKLEPIGWAVLAIALISLVIDLVFGICRFCVARFPALNKKNSEQVGADDPCNPPENP